MQKIAPGIGVTALRHGFWAKVQIELLALPLRQKPLLIPLRNIMVMFILIIRHEPKIIPTLLTLPYAAVSRSFIQRFLRNILQQNKY